MKWVLIGLGALIVFQFLQQQNRSSGGGFISGNSGGGTGVNGFITSLSSLTNSIGKIFGSSNSGGSTTVKDRDALITPDF